jgi:hypothetical protein
MRSTKTLLLLILGAAILTTALQASATEGVYFSISGNVTDANWNPIPGALVTLYDNDFNRIATQYTLANGYFSFEGISVKSYLCNVRIAYTDNGTEYTIPGYYIPAYPAKDEQHIDPKQTHFDDYYLPDSKPLVTLTPTPVPTAAPTATPLPENTTDNSTVTLFLLFAGGFIAGASVATLACFIILRPNKKP